MRRPERLPPDPRTSDSWSDDSVTIQLEANKAITNPPVTSIDPDKTTQVDLSGLAMFMPDGVDSIDVRREAPTRRFGCERTSRGASPDAEAPSGLISGVAEAPKIRRPEPHDSAPNSPGSPARAVCRPSHASARLERTTVVRRRRPQTDSVGNRVLRGLAIFAWGFATATVLWLYLETQPRWREHLAAAASTLWSTFADDRADLPRR
jgi:hypothetical protein